MLKNILDYSEEEYEQKREVFMQKMQYYDDGHASEAVVDYILEHTEIRNAVSGAFIYPADSIFIYCLLFTYNGSDLCIFQIRFC